jgi:hypothetical protein
MITYNDIIELGWNDRHPNSDRPKNLICNKTFVFPSEEGYDYYIMGIYKYSDDEDIYLTQIKCVPESTDHNEWENSECHFYGYLQTKEELKVVMRQLEIGTDCYGNPEPYEKIT